MDVKRINGSLIRLVVPPGTVTVRAFVNGTPVGKCLGVAKDDAPSDREFTMDVRLDEIASTAMCEALPFPTNEGVLLQVYAFDKVGQTIANGEHPAVELPSRRSVSTTPRSMASADQNRLVATAMHKCGDVHVWEFPVRRLLHDNPTYIRAGYGVHACVV
jgi:hypothetical protein